MKDHLIQHEIYDNEIISIRQLRYQNIKYFPIDCWLYICEIVFNFYIVERSKSHTKRDEENTDMNIE